MIENKGEVDDIRMISSTDLLRADTQSFYYQGISKIDKKLKPGKYFLVISLHSPDPKWTSYNFPYALKASSFSQGLYSEFPGVLEKENSKFKKFKIDKNLFHKKSLYYSKSLEGKWEKTTKYGIYRIESSFH